MVSSSAKLSLEEREDGDMFKHCLLAIGVSALCISSAGAQQVWERRASIRGGGGPGGKCTIEVVVDGVSEVEIRGDRAVLRNLEGQPPQWRRFECNSPMPDNPTGFRFQGIDGRGRQTLMRDPSNGGAAVIRIEDPQSGQEGYTFDVMWAGAYPGGGNPGGGNPGGGYPGGGPGRPDGDRRDQDFGRGPDRGRDQDRPRDQDQPRDQDMDAYHRDRADWFRGDQWRQQFFQRIREDVEHVRSVTFPFGADQYRLQRTLQELDDLQGKLSRGRYDRDELNDVTDALGRVLRDNRLAPRDRDILSDDLDRLRQFRDRHGEWGVR